jgi:RNA-binding protein
MKLTGKQTRYLRGLGHHLKPVVMIGKEEVSNNVIAAVDEALEDHELIKVKLQEGCLSERREVAQELTAATAATSVQILGNNILLYRQSKEPRIALP